MTGLFRKEATDARSMTWLGSVHLTSPVSHTAWVLLAVLTSVSICAGLALGHYTKRQRVSGVLVPSNGLVSVTAKVPATVSSTPVKEGQLVRAGQPLVILSMERRNEAVGNASEALKRELQDQIARLKSDLSEAKHLADIQIDTLQVQRANLVGQITLLDGEIRLVEKKWGAIKDLLSREQPLVKSGYISQLQLQQQEAQSIDMEVQAKTLRRQRLDLAQQLPVLDSHIKQASIDLTTRSNDIDRQIAQIKQTNIQNEADDSQTLTAPQDGIVSSVLVKRGQSIALGQTLIHLVPLGSKLEAELFVPSSAIGFIAVGESVSLRYEPYPYQKFGIGKGLVRRVSNSALTPAEVYALLGVQPPAESQYRIIVTLNSQSVRAYGTEHPLKPGMALEADIQLSRRTFFEWIFEPLYGMKNRS